MSICMNLDAHRVISNLYEIAALQTGDKLICNSQAGEIKVDDRAYFVSLRRGYYGAHDNALISQTFEAAMDNMKKDGEAQSIAAFAVADKTTYKNLGTLFDKALDGLSKLSQTYVDEGKDPKVQSIEYRFRNELMQLRSASGQIAQPLKKTEDDDENRLFISDEEIDDENELTSVLSSGLGLSTVSKENKEKEPLVSPSSLLLEEDCDSINDDSIQADFDQVDKRSQDVCDAVINRIASIVRWLSPEGAADE